MYTSTVTKRSVDSSAYSAYEWCSPLFQTVEAAKRELRQVRQVGEHRRLARFPHLAGLLRSVGS